MIVADSWFTCKHSRRNSIWSTFTPLFILETPPIPIKLVFDSDDQDMFLKTSAWAINEIWKVSLGLVMGMDKIIQELASGKIVDGESRWLWPRLCELRVNDVSREGLLRMLEARAEAATAEDVSDN
ncbi:hypothetical protein FRB95_013927 [Tulasnella sp. JGI-2019a]|nr:hypothetical protein FRB95_013927 [Tulasnella sp. JGI-2019a]